MSVDKRVLLWRIMAYALDTVDELGVHMRIRCSHNRMTTVPLVGRRIPSAVVREIEDDLACCLARRGL